MENDHIIFDLMSSEEISLTKAYPSIHLTKEFVASEGFQQMANKTIYGTPGKMRYAHKNCITKIQSLKNTTFLEFKRNENLLGIVALVGHHVSIAGAVVHGQYVRYFSMNHLMKSEGQRKSGNKAKRGVLHQMMKELFDNPSKLSNEANQDQSIIYAYVESTNERSLNMVKSMGFTSSRQLVTLLFSRFYPKKKLDVKQLEREQESTMTQLVRDFYSDYNLVTDFSEWENYHIYEEGGEIVCGLKLESNSWQIYEMPGVDGWLFRKVLPTIPILKRVFQKDKIDFIGIERLHIKAGFEHLLPDFLETLCYHFGVTKALIGVDNQSPLYYLLKTKGKLGLLDKIINPSPGILFCRTYGIPNETVKSLDSKPFYVSTYDMS